MAGAGYKLFATGDVLTAAQVNTYLMQQTIMVFANSTARTTALSGVLAEGMFSYLQDTNSTEYYDGSTWQSVSNPGDITAVTAGAGLSGGGSSGAVTLAINTPYVTKTDNYTIASGDEGKLFSMNAATAKSFSIPTDATFNFDVGTTVNFVWITGVGQPDIKAVTSGTTTVISTGATSNTPKLRVANSAATAIKIAANNWLVVGDIA
jgi:hypothetical protein